MRQRSYCRRNVGLTPCRINGPPLVPNSSYVGSQLTQGPCRVDAQRGEKDGGHVWRPDHSAELKEGWLHVLPAHYITDGWRQKTRRKYQPPRFWRSGQLPTFTASIHAGIRPRPRSVRQVGAADAQFARDVSPSSSAGSRGLYRRRNMFAMPKESPKKQKKSQIDHKFS